MLGDAVFVQGEQVHGEIEILHCAHVIQRFRQGVRNKFVV